MTLLLPTTPVAAYPPLGEDEHGWTGSNRAPVWQGRVNVQLREGLASASASDAGGHGPHGPAGAREGTVYMDVDCPVRDGFVLVELDTDVSYALSALRVVRDPTGGELDCLLATCTEVGRWPV